jgi:hypothetical protein
MIKDNYEIVYRSLMERVREMDFEGLDRKLGGKVHEEGLVIPLLGRPYYIDKDAVLDEKGAVPDVAVRIVLCHYLLQAGEGTLTGDWVSYRDFRDSAFFMPNFRDNAERPVAERFSGKPHNLERAAGKIRGAPCEEHLSGGICLLFPFLPRIPVQVVFYDRDDEFPASCAILFDRSAPTWLDMECLAVVGWITADSLIRNA